MVLSMSRAIIIGRLAGWLTGYQRVPGMIKICDLYRPVSNTNQ